MALYLQRVVKGFLVRRSGQIRPEADYDAATATRSAGDEGNKGHARSSESNDATRGRGHKIDGHASGAVKAALTRDLKMVKTKAKQAKEKAANAVGKAQRHGRRQDHHRLHSPREDDEVDGSSAAGTMTGAPSDGYL